MSETTNQYFPEVRDRAVRMILDNQWPYESCWTAAVSNSVKLFQGGDGPQACQCRYAM